jgi:hypothetical protein
MRDRDSGIGCLVFIAFVAGVGLFSFVAHSTVGASVSMALAALLIVGSVVFTVRRNRNSIYAVTDEAGIRITTRAQHSFYVPFSHLKHAKLERFLGQGQLRLEGANGPARSYTIAEAHAPDLADVINRGIQQQANAQIKTQSLGGAVTMLAKNDQPLDTWLHRVRDMARADYRERHLDADELLNVALDPDVDVEIRAAAAHAIIWLRDHEKATRVMEMIGKNTPPLIVVAVTLATMEGTYVAQYEDALHFLSKADRAIARKMIDERPKNLRIGVTASREPQAAEEQEQEALYKERGARN